MKRLIQVGATVAIGAGVVSKALYNGQFITGSFVSSLFTAGACSELELLVGALRSQFFRATSQNVRVLCFLPIMFCYLEF